MAESREDLPLEGWRRAVERDGLVRFGNARVFLDPEPERGAHPGIRGQIAADDIGVHYGGGQVEALSVDNNTVDEDWPMGEWFIAEESTTIPWHRVHSIQWGDNYGVQQ